jgi:dTDP-4-dehydrorhamnose reductase
VGGRVAIIGAAGQLGRELVRTFGEAGDEVLALALPAFDVTRTADLARLSTWRPDIVVNSAAWTDVDGCAQDPESAVRINGTAAGAVAETAARVDALVVQISTNEVFDGTQERPYTEADRPSPINPYGVSKFVGEQLVSLLNPRHLIVRTAWLFGPGADNFVGKVHRAAAHAEATSMPMRIVADEWGNPTWVPWLADAVRVAAERELTGLLHLAGQPAATRIDWARVALEGRMVSITPITSAEYRRPSRAPLRAILSTALAESYGISPISWRQPTRDVVSAALR